MFAQGKDIGEVIPQSGGQVTYLTLGWAANQFPTISDVVNTLDSLNRVASSDKLTK